jgi:hypothetical protein
MMEIQYAVADKGLEEGQCVDEGERQLGIG